jgi:hypothetical protein
VRTTAADGFLTVSRQEICMIKPRLLPQQAPSFHAWRWALALPLLAACALAFAQPMRGPDVRHAHGIAYVTGGIGERGQERVQALGKRMNLELVFAEARTGHYVADVDVRIADRRGREALSVDAADPLLFADLQPGSYRVSATFDGRELERTVTVPSHGHSRVVFRWPAEGRVARR